MYKLRTFPCEVCGVTVTKRQSAIAPRRCLTHAIAAAIDGAMQMHDHHGPAWDKWLANPGNARSRATPTEG